ncbi:MAG: NPCBM/NEW2 domain-containing protein [Chthonomonadales bacterium]
MPRDALSAPVAYVRQVRSWAREAFGDWMLPNARIRIRVLRQDHSTLHFGRSCIETPLRVGSQSFTHGLGTHAVSDLLVDVPAGARRFRAHVGVDNNYDTGGVRGSVVFVVLAGDRELFRSPLLRGGAPPYPVDVPVPARVPQIRLVVTDGGDGESFDQADWADAAFVMQNGALRYLDDHQLRLPFLDEGPPFSFTYGGRSSREFLHGWAQSRNVRGTAGGEEMEVQWKDPESGLEVTAHVRTFTSDSGVDWVLTFRNAGSADTPLLSDVHVLDLRLDTGFERIPVMLHELSGDSCSANSFQPRDVEVEAGRPIRLAPTGGRPSSASAFPFWDVQYGSDGVITGIGWTGQWAADLERSSAGPVRVTAGMERLRTVLHPGEAIRTPRILLMPWHGDRSSAYVRFRRMLFAHYVPRLQGKPLSLPLDLQCFDRYNSTPGWATEAGQMRYVRTAADLGVDTVWLDAAWFPGGFPNGVGNWYADPQRFPRGLKPIADAAHQHGMRFVVWFEPERVAAGSQIAKEHPEWVHGGSSGGLFKLDDDNARRWLTQLLIRRVKEYGIDIYRNDFNIDPLPFWRAADEPNREGITEIRYVQGLYAMWDAILRECPGVYIDNCASGGRRLDLEALMRSVPLWRSDTGCSPGHPEWNQMQSMALARYLPLFSVGVWSATPYEYRSGITAGANLEVPYLDANYDAKAWKRAVREMQSLRKYWYGDFFPIAGSGVAPEEFAAWQLHRPDLDEGVVFAFRRPACTLAGIVAPLRQVQPSRRYWVVTVSEGGKRAGRAVTGRELAAGLVLTLPKPGTSLLVFYSVMPEGAIRHGASSRRRHPQ